MGKGKLVIIETPTVTALLMSVKDQLLSNNQEFRIDYRELQWRSQVARRALRDFTHDLTAVGQEIDWKRYRSVYDQHRHEASFDDSNRTILNLNQESDEIAEPLRAWFKSHWTIRNIVANIGLPGTKIPVVELLIFALLYEQANYEAKENGE